MINGASVETGPEAMTSIAGEENGLKAMIAIDAIEILIVIGSTKNGSPGNLPKKSRVPKALTMMTSNQWMWRIKKTMRQNQKTDSAVRVPIKTDTDNATDTQSPIDMRSRTLQNQADQSQIPSIADVNTANVAIRTQAAVVAATDPATKDIQQARKQATSQRTYQLRL
jgi:hypothetical protein